MSKDKENLLLAIDEYLNNNESANVSYISIKRLTNEITITGVSGYNEVYLSRRNEVYKGLKGSEDANAIKGLGTRSGILFKDTTCINYRADDDKIYSIDDKFFEYYEDPGYRDIIKRVDDFISHTVAVAVNEFNKKNRQMPTILVSGFIKPYFPEVSYSDMLVKIPKVKEKDKDNDKDNELELGI